MSDGPEIARTLEELRSETGIPFKKISPPEFKDAKIMMAVSGHLFRHQYAYRCNVCNYWVLGKPEVINKEEVGGVPPERKQIRKLKCLNCKKVFSIVVQHSGTFN
jgi:uncharacterized protein with PIN domain